MPNRHPERHRTDRISWLRAAVLGANDGVISTAGLLMGVSAAHGDHHALIVSGVSGLVAGAMSMAAGEYVSVSSQADTERAELHRERIELHEDAAGELKELTGIYVRRGLEPALAHEVARQLTAHDALAAHARDELGITAELAARPLQAALASAVSFSAGALLPLLVAMLAPLPQLAAMMVPLVLLGLVVLGGAAAWIGGASIRAGAFRVGLWGALAMGLGSAIGRLFGTTG